MGVTIEGGYVLLGRIMDGRYERWQCGRDEGCDGGKDGSWEER